MNLRSTPASGVGARACGAVPVWLRTSAPPRRAGWGPELAGPFRSGYEPPLHPGERGGGQSLRGRSGLVTNLRSTPASGVGARACGAVPVWLRTSAPPRRAGWGPELAGPFRSGYEPPLHPGERGGGQSLRGRSGLVTNLRSTPASGVGARACGAVPVWLRTSAPPRRAGWGPELAGPFRSGYEPPLHPGERGGGQSL